jgi:hypothetical protein
LLRGCRSLARSLARSRAVVVDRFHEKTKNDNLTTLLLNSDETNLSLFLNSCYIQSIQSIDDDDNDSVVEVVVVTTTTIAFLWRDRKKDG